MKGLLKKDWYMTLRYGRILLIFIVFYSICGAFSSSSSFFALFNVLIGTMLVKSLMAYEEQNKWDSLAVGLPVTAKQLVYEKYLVGFIGGTMANAITFLAIWVIKLLTHRNEGSPILPFFFLYFAVAAFYLAVQMPVIFRFGTNQGRWAFIITVALAAALAGVLQAGLSDVLQKPAAILAGIPVSGLLAVLLVIAAAAVLISMKLSVHFYQKREF